MPTPRVALYARVSTERQAESQTIEQQLERLHAYAAQQAWPIGPEQTYRDDGVSGARLDRPALDRLRDAVARGDVDRVLITSPDRLARRYAYQVWLLEEFERAGSRWAFSNGRRPAILRMLWSFKFGARWPSMNGRSSPTACVAVGWRLYAAGNCCRGAPHRTPIGSTRVARGTQQGCGWRPVRRA